MSNETIILIILVGIEMMRFLFWVCDKLFPLVIKGVPQ